MPSGNIKVVKIQKDMCVFFKRKENVIIITIIIITILLLLILIYNIITIDFNSTVSLGKFGTFHTNVIMGKPFGHSYEIYDKDKVKIIKNVSFVEIGMISSTRRINI